MHDQQTAPPYPAGERPEKEASPSRGPLFVLLAVIALLGLSGGWPTLLVVAAIVVIIFLHELGHYLTAKAAGMKVTEFFLGFGPRIWSFRRGETEYGVKAIWVGAYVKVIGMNNLEEVPPEDEPRTYRQKPFWRRLSVAVAGSAMHFIIAFVCLFVLLGFSGARGGTLTADEETLRTSPSWQIESVLEGTPAAAAGLQAGDRVVAFDGQPVRTYDPLTELIGANPERTLTLTVEREGTRRDVTVTLARRDDDPDRGYLGIAPTLPLETYSVIEAAPKAVGELFYIGWESIKGIGDRFSPSGIADFASDVVSGGDDGPVVAEGQSPPGGANQEPQQDDRFVSIVGAVGIGAEATEGGWAGLVFFLAILNIFIGIFNLVPLLPLDGGHVAIAVYEKIRSMLQGGEPYHADVAKLIPVTYAVVMVLIFVGLSSLYLDIVDPIRLG